MFAVNYNPVLDLLDLMNQQQRPQARPKITQKIETEDDYQIHISKPFGGFDSYEVRALRSGNGLVRLVIESEVDDFQASVSFALSDIDLQNTNWHYIRTSNTLVLSVPKKQKVCYPQFYFPGCIVAASNSRQQERQSEARDAERARQLAEQREVERRRVEAAKQREAEQARREAAIQARRAAEEQARREAARRVEEAKREAEKAKRVAEEKRRAAKVKEQAKLEERKERVRREAEARQIKAQQEQFVKQLFESFFPPLLNQSNQTSTASQPQRTEAATEQTTPRPAKTTTFEKQNNTDKHNDDNESVQSEPLTPEVGSPRLEGKDESLDLHKHPSLEEVEDEEFVMFRKKFGQ